MTLIIMCLITALTVAFLAFTSTEPAIASNQMMNAQARAIAESGVERAIWALTKGDAVPGAAGAGARAVRRLAVRGRGRRRVHRDGRPRRRRERAHDHRRRLRAEQRQS